MIPFSTSSLPIPLTAQTLHHPCASPPHQPYDAHAAPRFTKTAKLLGTPHFGGPGVCVPPPLSPDDEMCAATSAMVGWGMERANTMPMHAPRHNISLNILLALRRMLLLSFWLHIAQPHHAVWVEAKPSQAEARDPFQDVSSGANQPL